MIALRFTKNNAHSLDDKTRELNQLRQQKRSRRSNLLSPDSPTNNMRRLMEQLRSLQDQVPLGGGIRASYYPALLCSSRTLDAESAVVDRSQ